MNQARFDALAEYETSPLFTGKDRAALDYVTALTRGKKVDPETFARLAAQYSDREICEIVWLVASEHVYNLTDIGLNIHSDMLCDLARKNKQGFSSALPTPPAAPTPKPARPATPPTNAPPPP